MLFSTIILLIRGDYLRLWHEDLISKLPRQQLLGQHRECAALRGNGWGKPHSTVNYVFNYNPYLLFKYHTLVMDEMIRRGYNVSKEWYDKNYRGKNSDPYKNLEVIETSHPIYPEHDKQYYKECILNIKEKKIEIE